MNKKEIINNVIWFASLLLILFLVRTFVFSPVAVSGDSMVPTLKDKERVMQVKLGEIKRFDIVTFPAPDQPGQNYIKRVIGLPGDTVAFKKDELYINGEKVEETYLKDVKKELSEDEYYTYYTDQASGKAYTDFSLKDIKGIEVEKIPEGKVFVLGDNRPISKDSRYIGLINIKDITGDVKVRFWPLNQIGILK